MWKCSSIANLHDFDPKPENSKLKRLVADLSLDRHVLQEIVAKKL
jgi:hypothetical protein